MKNPAPGGCYHTTRFSASPSVFMFILILFLLFKESHVIIMCCIQYRAFHYNDINRSATSTCWWVSYRHCSRRCYFSFNKKKRKTCRPNSISKAYINLVSPISPFSFKHYKSKFHAMRVRECEIRCMIWHEAPSCLCQNAIYSKRELTTT